MVFYGFVSVGKLLLHDYHRPVLERRQGEGDIAARLLERKLLRSTAQRIGSGYPEALHARGSVLQGRLNQGVDAVLFDTDAFTYDAIMYWMYNRASEGKRYTMGLYSEKTGKLITEDEVL